MANWELQVISSVVRAEEPSKAWETLLKQGLQFRTFGNMEAKSLFSAIDAHYRRPNNFGHIPSEESLSEQFPGLDLPRPLENLPDLIEKVKHQHVKRESEKLINGFMEQTATDPIGAVTDLYDKLGQLQEEVQTSDDVVFSQVALEETIEELSRNRESEGLTGIPWPWARMNRATNGIQPGDYIMIWALPKSMKTWFGLVVAAHVLATGRRVLVYSKEMTWTAVRRRVSSILSKVNYTRLKNASLSRAETAHLLETQERLADPDFPGELIFTNCDRPDGSPGGPAEVRRKIEIYQPHFVLLDSSYMLELPGNGNSNALDWKVLSSINRQLKQIAKSTGIPVLSILQENERSAYKYSKSRGTASLAMNTGAVMDCDVGIRLVYHPKKQELSVHLAAARETTDPGFTIHALASENFGYAHDKLYSLGDVQDEDDGGEDAEVPPEDALEIQPAVVSPLMEQARNSREPDEIDEDVSQGS